ncbi:MAG TPA: hypothetical protein VE760_01810 [Acidimicrobiales bacterium]|nr:hypothetical protein [Acidimicrobiales bacterium]
MSELEAAGFGGQVGPRPGGRLLCFTCRTESDASSFGVTAMRRTEGVSDPDDMLAVVALTCPRCETQATVVLGYGPEAGEDDSEVLRTLPAPA